MYYSISVNELYKILEDIKIIDIRDSYDVKFGIIGNAVNVERIELLVSPEKYLSKYYTYYIYCNSGKHSKDVSIKLNELGYKVIDIAGGYVKWLAYLDS